MGGRQRTLGTEGRKAEDNGYRGEEGREHWVYRGGRQRALGIEGRKAKNTGYIGEEGREHWV